MHVMQGGSQVARAPDQMGWGGGPYHYYDDYYYYYYYYHYLWEAPKILQAHENKRNTIACMNRSMRMRSNSPVALEVLVLVTLHL